MPLQQVGQDTLSFVAGCAPITQNINLLCGPLWRNAARDARTNNRDFRSHAEGSFNHQHHQFRFPRGKADSAYRYQRSREVIEILKQGWLQDSISYSGDIYEISEIPSDPARPYQDGGPLLYFGGYSPDALELCGQYCDVYLMWPETKELLAERMIAVHQVAQRYGRTLDYGLRVHMVVRDTETEAREYADYLVSKLDDDHGTAIRNRAQIQRLWVLLISPRIVITPTNQGMSSLVCGPGLVGHDPGVAQP